MHGIKSASAAPQEEGEHIIATYELIYQRGKVIVLGIYSDNIITNSKFDKSFDNLVLRGWIS